MGGGNGGGGSIMETPTWALATVCFVFISLGILIEYLIHLLTHWLEKHGKKALFDAVEKLKSVLMLLGFMSLLLAITQRPISNICVPERIAFSMLPCHRQIIATNPDSSDLCASSSSSKEGGKKNMASFISQEGVNQLNNFIFGLAIMQIAYSLITMGLGRAKMRRWEVWEKESQSIEYLVANDPNRFRLTKQTTFGRRHANSCTTTPIHLWIKCFFRQFLHSVAKVDYLTLRHAFIATHLPPNNNSFNFQKYIQRSLEDDFKLVVGIRPFMWFVVVIFLLIDVHGWHAYLFVSFLPLFILPFVLAIGTKLEVVVAEMAIQLKDENTVIKGPLLLQPNDNLFWFSQPNFVLTILHYTLFMNAFEITFFIWVTIQYGIKSCYHEHVEIVITRVVLAIVVQVMCSYITLPLYALVTQMGTHFKSAVLLEDQTVHTIKQWHAEVKDKRKKTNKNKDKNIVIDQQTGSSSNHHNDGGGISAVETEIQELDDHDPMR